MLVVVVGTCALKPLWDGRDTDQIAEEIRERAPRLERGYRLEIAGGVAVTVDDLAAVYELRDFRPLWSADEADDLERFVSEVVYDGLDPAHYHGGALSADAADEDRSPGMKAERDILRTQAFMRLARDLRHGRVDPLSLPGAARIDEATPQPEEGEEGEDDPLGPADVERRIAAGDIVGTLEAQRPDHPVYRRMVEAMETYRDLLESGGWPELPEGPLLALDSTSARVPLLRERLAAEGYLEPESDLTSPAFDAALDEAVRRFQHTHGLNDDGVVGPSVIRELNRSPGYRVEQLRANLERARWVLRDLPDTYVTVNIAGQRVYLIRNDSSVWETRVIVGDEYTRTPVFSAPMRRVVFNPDWTVPESINSEILQNLREDEDYLERENFEVLDGNGRPVDPDGIDFSEYSGEDFPYTFRQRPGPGNTLGRVKFMFPNRFAVYLHDTPSRELFQREDRTFSHGCIRVEHPLDLAELLLPSWTPEEMEATVEAGRMTSVELDDPLPVLLLYWTVSADLHGELHFYRDAYDRDAAVLAALDRGPGDDR